MRVAYKLRMQALKQPVCKDWTDFIKRLVELLPQSERGIIAW